MTSKNCLFVLLVLSLMTVGCATRIGDFTAVSTKNVYAKGTDLTKLPQQQGIEGQSIKFLGIGQSIEDAVNEALEKGNGNLMIDCQLYFVEAPFFNGFRVRGTVVKVPYAADRPTGSIR